MTYSSCLNAETHTRTPSENFLKMERGWVLKANHKYYITLHFEAMKINDLFYQSPLDALQHLQLVTLIMIINYILTL